MNNTATKKSNNLATGIERRTAERLKVTIQMVAIPFGDQITTLDRIAGTTRDISDSGIGFLTDVPIESRYVKLRFYPLDQDELTIMARVVRCARDGEQYHVGCEFVQD